MFSMRFWLLIFVQRFCIAIRLCRSKVMGSEGNVLSHGMIRGVLPIRYMNIKNIVE